MVKLDWQAIKEEYPVGCKVKGIVTKVWKYGCRVELEDGVVGIIRNREMSWDSQVDDATTFLHQDEPLLEDRRIRVAVLRHDSRKKQLVLSLRLAVHDPWENQGNRYEVGKTVEGRVVSMLRTNAVIELPDHVQARLPYDEIVPWKTDSPERILDRGDFIEAKVKGKDNTARVILLSMRDRLEDLGREISRHGEETTWISPSPGQMESVDEALKAYSGIAYPIERILIVDNEEEEGFQLEALLNDLDYEDIDVETDFAEAVRAAVEDEYDLILMDVRDSDDDFAGLHAAETIQGRKSKILIVLVTGVAGDDWIKASQRAQALDLAGMILKPVTRDNLEGALATLKRVTHAGWPMPLAQSGARAIEFVQNISKAAAIRRPLPQVLNSVLEQVAKATGADKAAIFSMDPRRSWVDMPASVKIPDNSLRRWRRSLPKSPVNDVIYRGEHIFENDIERFEGKYRYLRRMISFGSCIGVPVRGAAGDLGYGLFLLQTRRDHFTEYDLVRAEAAAAIIGQTIREYWVVEQVAADQRLTLLGGAITSIGHELRGRLGALEAVPSVDRAWSQLKRDSTKLADPGFVQRMEDDLKRLTVARQGLAELADVFLGAVKQSQEQIIDVRTCVKSACNLMAQESVKSKVDLVLNLDEWIPGVRGSRLELEQVFMNILLNAIQQMPQSRRQRGRVTITTSYCREDRRFPVRIAFSDSGPGIHTKHLEKIFEPMYTTKPQGTGMGLYICRELLALMDGQIRIEQTAILIGTTFVVELPDARMRR